MSEQSKSTLKTYFQTGQVPNQSQFEDLIDSLTLQSDFDPVKEAQDSGVVGYETKASLDADTTQPDQTLALVTNDSTASNNGYYRWDDAGGSWVKRDEFYATDPEVDDDSTTSKAAAPKWVGDYTAALKKVLPNIAPNGFFDGDINGWNLSGNTTISYSSGDLLMEQSATGTFMGVFSDTMPSINTSDKYYIRAKFVPAVVQPNSAEIAMPAGSNVQSISNPELNEINIVSGVVQSGASSGNRVQFITRYDGGDSAEVTVNNILVINLTDAFGAGNEPTKEEVDAFLTNADGLIEAETAIGEVLLSKKAEHGFSSGEEVKTLKDVDLNTSENKSLISNTAPNQTTYTHRVLMVGTPYDPFYVNRIAEDLYRCGFLMECCSWVGFHENYSKWKNDFDVIVISNTNLPYHFSAKGLTALRGVLGIALNDGKKVIYLHDDSSIRLTTLGFNGTNNQKEPIADLFDNISVSTSTLSGENQITESGLSRSIVHDECRVEGNVYDFSSIAGVDYPLTVDDGSNSANLMALKKGEWAIIGYGGVISGDLEKSSTYKYIDYANLIFELLEIDNDDRLAMDYKHGEKVGAVGVDCDYSADPDAIRSLIECSTDANGNVKQEYNIEFGFVSSKIDKSLANEYKGLRVEYGNIHFCSHTQSHYSQSSDNFITVTEESYTIDSDGLVFLKRPFKAEITEIKSADGNTTYTRAGDFQFTLPGISEYACNLISGQLVDGILKFNTNNVGEEIKITYTYFDLSDELFGSISELQTLGLLTNKTVYTTMYHNSVDYSTLELCKNNDITVVEYLPFPRNYRLYLFGLQTKDKFPYLNGSMSYLGDYNNVDDINIIKNYTYPEFRDTVLPEIEQTAEDKELPIITYIHDMPISEVASGSVWNDNDGTFNADWKKGTYQDTKVYLQGFYERYFNVLSNGVMLTRGDYTKYYQYINKYLKYDFKRTGNKVYLYVGNKGGKPIEGITFRIEAGSSPSSAVKYKDEPVNMSYDSNNSLAFVDFDISAGEKCVVIITL